MRSFLKSSVLVLTLAIAGSAASYAQVPQDQSQGPRGHGQWQGRMADPAFETKMLTRRLNLSPQQSAQVQPILADRQARMQALKPAEGTQPDFKALRQQHKAIMEDTQTKLNAILTPEQQQEFAKMHEHRGGHGPRGNGKQQNSAPPAV